MRRWQPLSLLLADTMEPLPAPSAVSGSMQGDVADSSPLLSLLPAPSDGAEQLLLAFADSSPLGQSLHALAELRNLSNVIQRRTDTVVFVMCVCMCSCRCLPGGRRL